MKTPRLLAVALLVSFAAAGRADQPTVTVASKSFTESVILGEALAHLVRSTGAQAVHRAELGGTQVLWQTLVVGDVDAYVEYTGTISREVLPGEQLRSEEDMRKAIEKHGVRMSGRLGFNNNYVLGMKEQQAAELGIRTISDLAKRPELRFGFSDEFMARTDGWPGLQREYALPQRSVRGMEHNLAYRGIAAGSLDITDLYSTDAEIAYYKLRVLEDDRGYFPVYYAVLLYRADLEKRAPAVVEAFRKLEGRIDNAAMMEMNGRTKLDGERETRVAAAFLNDRLSLGIPVPVETNADRWGRVLSRLWQNTLEHLYLVSVSLAAAIAVSVPLGVLAAKKPAIGQVVLGVVGIIQTLPSLAVLVFMIPLFGLDPMSAIVALFLYSLLPIVRNTVTGLRDIPASLRESAEVLGLPPFARLRLVELPIAARSILAGIKTAAVINVGTATLGAFIGAGGYGQPIQTGIRLNNVGLILQGAVPAAVLALLVQGVFELAERRFVSRGLRGTPG